MIDVLNVSAEVVAAIFGIAVTAVAIIVQLAATRFNHQITSMFIRDPVNILVLSFYLATTLLCIWIAAIPDVSNAFSFAGIGFVTLALVLLLPYFGYVFTFISPLNVIQREARLVKKGIDSAKPEETIAAIDQLQDVARNATDQGERAIALACVDAFSELFSYYQSRKSSLPESWFTMEGLERDPDFVSFEPSAMSSLINSHLWFESKILHQFLNIMWMSVPNLRDVASSLGIAVKRIAVTHTDQKDILDISIRAMNSFLRASINARDARTSYHLLSQYRSVAEVLLLNHDTQFALSCATHIAAYGRIAFATNQSFILEVAAFDMAALIRCAHTHDKEALPGLMTEFLELDQEERSQAQEESLTGVRRAQIQVATYFLKEGEMELVESIIQDLQQERADRLLKIVGHLKNEDRDLFWEFTPRSANFNYLEPELRPYLDQLTILLTK